MERVHDKLPKYHMKMPLANFNAKGGREDIFKPTIWNESLHEIGNDNGVRVVNFVAYENSTVKSTMFPHRNIHKYTWLSPGWKTHNHIDHILIERRNQSSVLDVRSFKAVYCDSDNYLVVAKVRERLTVNKQRSHRFHAARLNLKKLIEVEGKEKYRAKVSNRFTPLKDLDAGGGN
jgi:hypothetical protein